MKISFHEVLLKKRFPLEISRGVNSESYNVFVRVEENGFIGWGESAPGKEVAEHFGLTSESIHKKIINKLG